MKFSKNNTKKKSSFKKTIKYIKFIIPLILITIIIFYLRNLSIKNDLIKKSDFVSEKLSSISELASTKYDYSNVISIKDNLTFKDFNIPFTEKSFVVKYSGHITAGVDLSEATFTINRSKLTISMPKCKILSHTVDQDDISVFDERTSIFNKLTMDDMISEIITDKNQTEETLLERGFLDEVTNNTEELLKNIFSNCGFDEVTIETIDS